MGNSDLQERMPDVLRREFLGVELWSYVGILALVFIALATLNAGGYRYGASDQAFYVPAVLLQLDPALFPRDHAVLAAQTHLTVVDELIAGTIRLTGVSLPAIRRMTIW